jgi:hypothetical protein
MDLQASEERLKGLESKVRDFQRTVTDLREKGRKYDEVLARAKAAEGKYDDLRALAESQASALNSAADTEKKVVQKSIDNERQLQLLAMDKSFLQKELEMTVGRAERAEREAVRGEELMREAVVKRDEALMQLAEARHETRRQYEEKLEKELGRLRAEQAREIGEIRSGGNAIWERENAMLKEARAEALKECSAARGELAELRGEHDGLVLAHARDRADLEGQVVEMRGEAKMKGFEAAKMGASLEEMKLRLKEAELGAEHLRQQLGVHQTEFVKLREEAKGVEDGLRGVIKAKDEQVRF